MTSSSYARAARAQPLFAGLASMFKPRRRQKLSTWAEEHLVLPVSLASSPGPYRIGDAHYQRGMLDKVTDPDVEQIVMVTSSQVGKTTILTAVQGYYAECEPSPQLAVFPTNDLATEHLDEKFQPTVDASPALAQLFNGLTYPGGYIALVGANTPAKLAARPIRIATGDEVDRWPLSSGKEGSPVDLIEKRTTTFRNGKKLYASTPLATATSQIVAMFKQCTQLYYLVVCPDCARKQVLKWENVKFEKGREEKATYHCENCGAGWDEGVKRRLVRDADKMGGGWSTLPEAPFKAFKQTERPRDGHVGFWICELYSPWSSMVKMAVAWTHAEGTPANEQTFYNTRLGLPWDGSISNSADAELIGKRRESYSLATCPKRAGLVTASVDIQDDRFEVLFKAWGVGDESWLLDHIVMHVDPSVPSSWNELAEVLQRRYPHEAGKRVLSAEVVCIDSGGHFTQSVYKFCAKHQKFGRHWLAIKGVPGEGRIVMELSKQKFKLGTKLYLVGVDDAKTTIYTRLGIGKSGPGYIHMYDAITDDQIKQMTCEYAVIEYDTHGFPKRSWEKPRNARNEMLDLLVYNLAARNHINIDMVNRLMRLNEVEEKRLDAEAIGRLYRNE